MNYATIKNCDIANGPGVRVSLFVSGCTHRCPGCFNEVAWDFDYGQPFTQETIDSILEMLRPSYIRGLTLLGGEPFEPANQRSLLPFIRRVREMYPEKNIIERCAMMHDRGTEELLKMWSRVKGDSSSAWTYILICLVFAGLIAAVIVKYTKKRYRRRRYAMRRRKR